MFKLWAIAWRTTCLMSIAAIVIFLAAIHLFGEGWKQGAKAGYREGIYACQRM